MPTLNVFRLPQLLVSAHKKSVSDFPFLVWQALVNPNQETKKKQYTPKWGGMLLCSSYPDFEILPEFAKSV